MTTNNMPQAILFALLLAVLFIVPTLLAKARGANLWSQLGTVTKTYYWPVQGTTDPTVNESLFQTDVVVDVNMADGDTSATITHNWQLSTTALARGLPLAQIYTVSGGTAIASLRLAITNSIAVTLSKDGGTGSGGTFRVILRKPISTEIPNT